jgi:gliding motility-associated-like protein
MSNQVSVNTAKALNISRFDKNGVARWSRNYTGMDRHTVYNIHTQGTGFLVLGTVNNTNPYSSFYSQAFMLKVDSMGVIINGASGICAFQNRTLLPLPFPVNEIDPRIDSVVNYTGFLMASNPVLIIPKVTDATLYCHEQSSCTPVNLVQSGAGCSLQDTLVFYLTNNSCGVSANWQYDTAYFTLVHLSGDTLKLVPKHTGTSIVKAEVEDDCSLRVLSTPVSVLISASSVSLGADTVICSQGTVTLRAGPGYQTYRWNDNSTDSTLTVNAPGLYYVTVTDFCGGTGTDSILVSIAGADFMITGNPEKCNADTVVLQATAGYINYIWSPASYINATGNIARVYPPVTMDYYIQAEKFPGCIVRDTFQVKVNNSPPVYIGNDTTICYDQSVQLTASSGFISYLWNTGSTANNITVTNPGMYTIQALYVNNCISKDTVQLGKYPFAYPRLGKDTAICSNTVYQLRPGNYAQYTWSTAATSSSIDVAVAGTYWVMVTDLNGCSAADTIIILQKQDCVNVIYFPTAFTPGNDGRNDVFKPVIYGQVLLLNFEVYNRWGQLVFQTSAAGKGWDGKLNGQPQDGNVFVWVCRYQPMGKPVQFEKGTFMLIR